MAARANGDETLTITDNRTGQSYELPVVDGAIRAADLRRLEATTGDGSMLSYDPALTNTALCRSAITFVDGERGILQHRGYAIEDLVEKSTYLEVAYLLIHGDLP